MSKDPIKIKVCGLTKSAQIQELISLNIDFLGFIFYERSPRFVLKSLSLEEIKDFEHSGKVGVFVNESVNKILVMAKNAGLNYIQLHGDEDENFILELRRKLSKEIQIIKVVRIGNQLAGELQKTLNNQPSAIEYFLFDTDSQSFGGTGKSFDWNILKNVKIDKPYFLSGGISLENIQDLESFVKGDLCEKKTFTNFTSPFALDINSKFEIEPGDKDLKKIKEFKSLLLNQKSLKNTP